MIPERLEATNLRLRPFSPGDGEAVFEYWQSDPGWERYNESVPSNFSLADAREFVRALGARERELSPSWAIVQDGQVVGIVSITFEQDHRFAVVGYGIHGDLRGRGLAGQAVSTIIDESFNRYRDLQIIRAHTDARNIPSIRVLLKLGFRHEGALEQKATYCLLREHWCSDRKS